MKKALSVLLMVTMLVCLSAAAFADPSPEQDTPTDYGWPLTPAAKAPLSVKSVEIVAEDAVIFDEDSDVVVDDAASDDLDAAVKLLTVKNLNDAFSVDKALMKAADGKTAVCSNPQAIFCESGEYPCFVKYTVDYHVDTVMLYSDGAWSVPADLEIVDNEDGSCTVSFTLEGPALYTNISFK